MNTIKLNPIIKTTALRAYAGWTVREYANGMFDCEPGRARRFRPAMKRSARLSALPSAAARPPSKQQLRAGQSCPALPPLERVSS
jgi:hypothetical protein